MTSVELTTRNYKELKEMAAEMGLKARRSKRELVKDITEGFKEYEKYSVHTKGWMVKKGTPIHVKSSI